MEPNNTTNEDIIQDPVLPQTWEQAVNHSGDLNTYGGGISPRPGKPLRSSNFVSGEKGWNIDNNGNAEFNDGTFRGTFNIGGTNITIDNTKDIQTYLDIISTAGGGTLFLQPGTYTLTSDILIPSGVTLQGVSRDGVIIDCNASYAVKIVGSNTYSTGTVTINNGATSLVGSGTTWTSAMVGRYVLLDGLWYEITAFTDTTHITISTYQGDNLSGSTYVLATVNFSTIIQNLTVTGATGSGIVVQYAQECQLNNLVVYDNGTGIEMDYVVFPKLEVTSNENGVNLNMSYVEGFYIDYSEFNFSTTGAGIIMANTRNATLFNSSINDNTGDGLNLTTCSKIAFISFDISGNGGQGVEMVSGCNDNQFTDGVLDGNTSDGFKMTATSDRNILVAMSVKNSGGYGINIAASTCDNNQIIAPAFDNNSSGTISDSGTSTTILPQEFTDYTTTQITSLAGTEPTTWTDLNLSSIIGTTQKVVLLKLVSTGSARLFAFRTNGDTAEYHDHTSANSAAMIKTDAVSANTSSAGTAIVKTDASGVIEWISDAVTPGITFGNTTIDHDQVSGTTSHNNNGDFLVVAVNSTTNDVSAMTYAGVAMTQLDSAYLTSWSSRYHSIWYLANPASGTNNVVTTGGTAWQFNIFSASGVDQENPITGTTTTTNQTSSNPTVNVTTTIDDAYVVVIGQINDTTVSAGTDTTKMIDGTAGSFYVFRSTNDTDTAGAFTLNITSTGNWRLRGFGLNPARTTLSVLAAW